MSTQPQPAPVLAWHKEAAKEIHAAQYATDNFDLAAIIAAHDPHAETVRLLEKLQDLLNAMPNSKTGIDCDIWKLWTDACNLVRDHLANLKGTP